MRCLHNKTSSWECRDSLGWGLGGCTIRLSCYCYHSPSSAQLHKPTPLYSQFFVLLLLLAGRDCCSWARPLFNSYSNWNLINWTCSTVLGSLLPLLIGHGPNQRERGREILQKLSNGSTWWVGILNESTQNVVFKILARIKMNLLKVSQRPNNLQSGRTSVSVDYLWRADYKWDVVPACGVCGVWTCGPQYLDNTTKPFVGVLKKGISDERKYCSGVWSSKLTHCWQLFCWCSWCCEAGPELVVTTVLKSSVFSSDLISGNSVIASIFIVIWSESCRQWDTMTTWSH